MEEGTLAKWLVKEGDSVKSGDIMAEIETDKATMEFEAVDEGVIAKILVAEGTDNVKVGTAIAVLAEEGEDASTVTETRSGEDANAAPKNEATDGASPPMPEGAAAAEQESGTQQLVAAAEAHAPATPEIPEGNRDGEAHRPRGAARCDGRGNARRRPRLRDGRGGRAISGRVQGDAGVARRVRRPPRHRHADHRIWLCRRRHRCGDGRPAPDHRVHDVQLRHAGDRPHHQLGRQDQLHVRRPDALPDRVPWPQRCRQPRRCAALAELRPLVCQRPRPDRDRAL